MSSDFDEDWDNVIYDLYDETPVDPHMDTNVLEIPGTNPEDRFAGFIYTTHTLDDIPEPEPLINGLLYRNSTAWMSGQPGHGKSFVALDMAGCIATGYDWQDHAVQPGPVLYLAAEGDTGLTRRVRAWENSYGRRMEGVTFLTLPVQVEHADWRTLTQFVVQLKASLVILDTQARITVGLEENSARDMGRFVHQLERLRHATKACILVLHHQGRGRDHMRGSSSLDGAADTHLQVAKDGDLITITNPKQKNTEAHEDMLLRLTKNDRSAVLTATTALLSGAPSTGALKFAVQWWDLFETDTVSVSKLIDACAVPSSTTYRYISELIRAGVAAKDTTGKYATYTLSRRPDPAAWAVDNPVDNQLGIEV